MNLNQYLTFDNSSFVDFEQTTIYGIFEEYGYMSWHIEIYPTDEENYMMFNSLVLEKIVSPVQLSNLVYVANNTSADLYGHSFMINGEDRFLKSIEMKFGTWDSASQSIALSGNGMIMQDGDLPEIPYSFSLKLAFTGINIFETTQKASHEFIDTFFPETKDRLKVKFEDVASGLMALIEGPF